MSFSKHRTVGDCPYCEGTLGFDGVTDVIKCSNCGAKWGKKP